MYFTKNNNFIENCVKFKKSLREKDIKLEIK